MVHGPAGALEYPSVLTPAELDRLSIVLVASRNPLNIGAAARAMSNFGFLRLRLVHPYAAAFREAKSAVDAESVLTAAEEFEQVAESVADCSLVVGTTGGARRNLQEPLHRLEAGSEIIRNHLRSGSRVALLFGSEKVGLSNDDLSHCQLLLRIPTRAEHPAMNLGQSVAILLSELVRETSVEKVAAAATEPSLATAGQRERLIALLLEALSFNGYAHRGTDTLMEEKVRRLVRHLSLTSGDLYEWLGLVRQLLWKLRDTQNPPLEE
jgi:TrmH family RNA methyltransferase